MTLLITVIAAVISTAIWYNRAMETTMNEGLLCCMFWGASIMWFVDAIFEYAENGVSLFNPTVEELVNDTFLGVSCIALALVIWIISVLIKDPKGHLKKMLFENKNSEQ